MLLFNSIWFLICCLSLSYFILLLLPYLSSPPSFLTSLDMLPYLLEMNVRGRLLFTSLSTLIYALLLKCLKHRQNIGVDLWRSPLVDTSTTRLDWKLVVLTALCLTPMVLSIPSLPFLFKICRLLQTSEIKIPKQSRGNMPSCLAFFPAVAFHFLL